MKYRFYIDGTLVHPMFSEDQAREWNQQSGEAFYRAGFTESFILLEDEYYIVDDINDVNHEFTFLCERLDSTSPIEWSKYFKGVFTKHNIPDYDDEDKLITFKPDVDDYYRKILDNYDREFNLIDLGIEKEQVNYKKYPLVQIYMTGEGATRLFNYNIGGDLVFEETNPFLAVGFENPGEEFVPAHLGINGSDEDGRYIFVSGSGLSVDVSGSYISGAGNTGALNVNGLYTFKFDVGQPVNPWVIVNGSNTVLYSSNENFENGVLKMTSMANNDVVEVSSWFVYLRVLCDIDTFDGVATETIPDTWVSGQRGFSKVAKNSQYNFRIHFSDDNQLAVTPYGQISTNASNNIENYYVKPSISIQNENPVLRDLWRDSSTWVLPDSSMFTLLLESAKTITLQDAYRLDKVIIGLLNKIAPNIHHTPVNGSSQFFYRTANPLTGEAQEIPYLTARSNIVYFDYDEAANTAKVKLKDLLRALNVMFGVKWDVYDWEFSVDPVFRIEHDFFYYLGMPFGYNAYILDADLNVLIEPHTQRLWNYYTSKWTYEKVDIPGRIKKSWGASVSDFFNGHILEIDSPYAQKEVTIDDPVPLILTDLNFALSNPDGVPSEGLFMLDVEKVDNEKWVREISYTDPNGTGTTTVQNGNLSLTVLMEKYSKYNLPAQSATLNGQPVTGILPLRSRKQTVSMFLDRDLDVMKTVWTKLGIGKIAKLREKMMSNEKVINLKHEV